jgi:hypothetical protein
LVISLLAQILGVVFFYLDWSQYPEAKPPDPPAIQAPAVGGAAPGGPGAPGGPPVK